MIKAFEQIGDYKVVRELGRGATGTVYLCVHETLGREVAIKVLGPEFVRDPELLERFRREGAVAAKLRHPNIVQVYDSAVRDDKCYIVMEYLGARTVADIMRSGLTPVEQATIYLDQLLGALEYAHAQGVVHRDIKPANIMVSDTNQIALTDFSIAHLKSATKLTQTGCAMGTPEYMAPEQFDGRVDHRADLYAAAIIFYEFLTGQCPFSAATLGEVMKKQLMNVPPALTSINPFIPVPLSEVVTRALDKDPNQRYQTAVELKSAIHSALQTPDAPPQSPPTQLDPPEMVPVQPLATSQPNPVPSPNTEQNVQPQVDSIPNSYSTFAKPDVKAALVKGGPVPGAAPATEPSPEDLLNSMLSDQTPLPVAIASEPNAGALLNQMLAAETPGSVSPSAFQRPAPGLTQSQKPPREESPSGRSSAPEQSQPTIPPWALLLACILLVPIGFFGLRAFQKAPPPPVAQMGTPTPTKGSPPKHVASPVAASSSPAKVAAVNVIKTPSIENNQVIPGSQLGDVRLSDSFEQARRVLGDPINESEIIEGDRPLKAYYFEGIRVAVDPANQTIILLAANGPGLSVDKFPEVAVGQVCSDELRGRLIAELGDPSVNNTHELRFVKQGLSISLDDGRPSRSGKTLPPNTISLIQIFAQGIDPFQKKVSEGLPDKVNIPPTAKLRPGQGLGEVSIGDTNVQVAKRWLLPKKSSKDLWWYGNPDTQEAVCSLAFDPVTGRVKDLMVFDPHFIVEGAPNCRVGGEKEVMNRELEALGGKAERSDNRFEYSALGLDFSFGDDDRCKSIKIYAPGKTE